MNAPAVAERLDGDLDFTVAHEHVDRVLHPLDRHRLPARRLAGADHDFISHDPQDAVRPAVGERVDLAADERLEMCARIGHGVDPILCSMCCLRASSDDRRTASGHRQRGDAVIR